VRIFGFAGWSGSGKTTLIERVIPVLVRDGLRVSLIKHAHHRFDVDHPGKDSYRHREAGCTEVLITSGLRWALLHELRGEAEISMDAALDMLSPCDITLVEGYKMAPIPKLEVWRAEIGKPLLYPRDPGILAIATDSPEALPASPTPRPRVLPLGDGDAIATFVVEHAIVRPLRR
jgi:molybdopterin-guanine dinucleotide biosynthesis protein B